MNNIQYKRYQLSDLSNLIIEYDRKVENKYKTEIVLLIMEQREQYCLSIYLPEFNAPVDLPISYGNIRRKGDIMYLNDVLSGLQIISKGIWEKNGNTLKLYDPDLRYSFLLLIRNGDLIRIRYQEDTDLYYLFPNKDRMYPFIMR